MALGPRAAGAEALGRWRVPLGPGLRRGRSHEGQRTVGSYSPQTVEHRRWRPCKPWRAGVCKDAVTRKLPGR